MAVTVHTLDTCWQLLVLKHTRKHQLVPRLDRWWYRASMLWLRWRGR